MQLVPKRQNLRVGYPQMTWSSSASSGPVSAGPPRSPSSREGFLEAGPPQPQRVRGLGSGSCLVPPLGSTWHSTSSPSDSACENLGTGLRKSGGGQGTACHLKLAAAGPEQDAEGGRPPTAVGCCWGLGRGRMWSRAFRPWGAWLPNVVGAEPREG